MACKHVDAAGNVASPRHTSVTRAHVLNQSCIRQPLRNQSLEKIAPNVLTQ